MRKLSADTKQVARRELRILQIWSDQSPSLRFNDDEMITSPNATEEKKKTIHYFLRLRIIKKIQKS